MFLTRKNSQLNSSIKIWCHHKLESHALFVLKHEFGNGSWNSKVWFAMLTIYFASTWDFFESCERLQKQQRANVIKIYVSKRIFSCSSWITCVNLITMGTRVIKLNWIELKLIESHISFQLFLKQIWPLLF